MSLPGFVEHPFPSALLQILLAMAYVLLALA